METVTIPNAIFGNYFFIVNTDIYDQVYEYTNEDDNIKISEVYYFAVYENDLGSVHVCSVIANR